MRHFIRKIAKLLLDPWLKYLARRYAAKTHNYSKEGLQLTIAPGVFHPGLFFSTRVLLRFMLRLQLKGQRVLELGAGSGFLSLVAASHGAQVTATDINPEALKELQQNAIRNKLEIHTLLSDLFDHLADPSFDFILINPPYYPQNPQSINERAWYCGEDFDYFTRLFRQLRLLDRKTITIYMVLSEDCAISHIQSIAERNELTFRKEEERMVWLEKNYVFRIL